MSLIKRRENVRNADQARNSFVTRRAEMKVGALTDIFAAAAGDHWVKTIPTTLQRNMIFSGFRYLESLRFIYNWENRFLSVNYNLQMTSNITKESPRYEETGDCVFVLKCTQKGIKGKRVYTWECKDWNDSEEKLNAYMERLSNPLILDRLSALDIMEMEIHNKKEREHWHITCESIIGSAAWILIPPVFSMVTPKIEECRMFLELFELLGDALINNKA